MKALAIGSLYLPVEPLLVLLVIAVGFCVMFGLRKLAASLVGFIVFLAALPLLEPIFDAIFGAMPVWMVWLVIIVMALAVLRWISNAMIGERASDHMVGILAADVVRYVVALPFRLIRGFLRMFFGGDR